MQPYGNFDEYEGEFMVSGFEIGPDFIKLQFNDGRVYLYDYGTTGAANIEMMKELAKSGSGLDGFINDTHRKSYAARLWKRE